VDALCENEPNRLLSNGQAQRKVHQLCRQVQRVLSLALADRGLFIEEVSPAPDCGRMLVQVVAPEGQSVAEALGALRREAPQLRTEVAMAISRKRAPELFFVPAIGQGGDDE
jgi:ribosome-binding factor A